MSNYFAGSRDSESKALDIERCREDFPAPMVPWEQLNIAQRAAIVSARKREAAGVAR